MGSHGFVVVVVVSCGVVSWCCCWLLLLVVGQKAQAHIGRHLPGASDLKGMGMM